LAWGYEQEQCSSNYPTIHELALYILLSPPPSLTSRHLMLPLWPAIEKATMSSFAFEITLLAIVYQFCLGNKEAHSFQTT
jgi:hypothetical protein